MIALSMHTTTQAQITIITPYPALMQTAMGSNIGDANAIHSGISAVVQDTLSSPANLYACVKALVDRDAVKITV